MAVDNEGEYWAACRQALRNYRQLARMGPGNATSGPMRAVVQQIVNELGEAEIAIDRFERHRSYLNDPGRTPMGASAPIQHVGPDGLGIFRGIFPDLESLLAAFDIDSNELEGYEVLLAFGEEEAYEGYAYVLLRRTSDSTLHEVHGSHCSCYGFEDQWTPEQVSLEELERRVEEDHRTDAQERVLLRTTVATLMAERHMLVPVEVEPIPTAEDLITEDIRHIEQAAAGLRPVIEARALEVGAL